MREFWALVGNSLKLKKKESFKSTLWFKLYVALLIIAAVVGFSILIYRGQVAPVTLLIVIPYLTMINFALAASTIRQEWRGQTVAWWLTLPHSRLKLLLAKLVANFIRFIKILGLSIAVLIILAVVGLVLNPAVWTIPTLSGIAITAVKLYALTIIVSPAAITLGMFLAVILHSRLKPFVPIIWILAGFTFSSASVFISKFFVLAIENAAISPVPELPLTTLTFLIYGVIVPMAMSAIFLGASTYILAEHTEV